jgi:hypothetical protein
MGNIGNRRPNSAKGKAPVRSDFGHLKGGGPTKRPEHSPVRQAATRSEIADAGAKRREVGPGKDAQSDTLKRLSVTTLPDGRWFGWVLKGTGLYFRYGTGMMIKEGNVGRAIPRPSIVKDALAKLRSKP